MSPPAIDRVAELRQTFDRSFAEPPSLVAAAVADLLDITLESTPYAVRVGELAGVFADMRITPVPSHVPELLGIAGCRGAILPVYDLRALVGHRAAKQPRWVAIAAASAIGLAFDRFDGHLRVDRDAIVARDGGGNARYMTEVARIDGVVRPIISIQSVVDAVASRMRAGAQGKE